LYHLHTSMPPLLIYRGGNTYPSIEKSTERFVSALREYVPAPTYHVLKGKHHIPMITQFFWTWNPRYKEIKKTNDLDGLSLPKAHILIKFDFFASLQNANPSAVFLAFYENYRN
jgi:hypothetical protein